MSDSASSYKADTATLSHTGDEVGRPGRSRQSGSRGRVPWRLQARSLARPGGTWSSPQARNSPFETRCPPRVSIKTYKKERPSLRTVFPMSGHWPRSISLAAASDYFFILVDSGQKTGIKRGFRVLRDTAQGSALRTRKPLKRFDPNFISPAGGTTLNLFPHLSPRPACGTKSFIFPIQKDFTIQQLTNTSIAV